MILTIAAAFVLALIIVAPPFIWLVRAMHRRQRAIEIERNFWARQDRNFTTGAASCVELDVLEEKLKREGP